MHGIKLQVLVAIKLLSEQNSHSTGQKWLHKFKILYHVQFKTDLVIVIKQTLVTHKVPDTQFFKTGLNIQD